MSDDDLIAQFNKKITFLKNLLWLASGLFAASIAVAIFVWSQLTGDFVRYGEDIRLLHVTPNSDGVKHYLWAYPTNSDRSMEVLAEYSDGKGPGDVASWDWKIVGPER